MDQRHKQRIIGAVVIVALAVIFLPMLLRGPVERSGLDVPMEIPPRPEVSISEQPLQNAASQPTLDRIPTHVSDSHPAAGKSPSAQPPQAPVSALRKDEDPDFQPPVEAHPQPEQESEQAPPRESQPSVSPELAAFVVQVGSFRSQDNASGLRNQLRDQGFSAFVEESSAGGEAIYRLRVGPVIERTDAEELMHRLKQDADLDGLVMSHP